MTMQCLFYILSVTTVLCVKYVTQGHDIILFISQIKQKKVETLKSQSCLIMCLIKLRFHNFLFINFKTNSSKT